jgi:WhiB family transcriptional regulator, redox-sensing transcriptional regulator
VDHRHAIASHGHRALAGHRSPGLVMPGSHRKPGLGVAASATAFAVGPDFSCCQDPELFFAESPRDVEQAKALCQGCRARIACLTGALGRGEPWGVWGGELLLRGEIVPRKRPRGRPRKTEVAA